MIRGLVPLPSLAGRTVSCAFTDTGQSPIGKALAPALAANPGLSGILPLAEPLDAFAARVDLARAASRSIDAQYYIWHDDLTGSLLFNELRAAADRNVRVRLLLDDNNTTGLDPVIAMLDAYPNIEIRLFNPFAIRGPRLLAFLTDFRRLNRRMHNKSFTVDNQVTIVGGRNVGDEYFGATAGSLFVDLDVLAAGPVVPEVSNDFDRYWASASSYPAHRIIGRLSPDRIEQAERKLDTIGRQPGAAAYAQALRQSRLVDRLLEQRLALDWSPVRMISDDPAKGLGQADRGRLFFPALAASMGVPKRELRLVTGYFVPTRRGTQALAEMARSGVAVTVLTNSLEATDVPIVHAGYAKWRAPLLRSGVRLFELRRSHGAARPRNGARGAIGRGSGLSGAGSALHAKTFAVDGRRLFVGSFNFDPRSANLNSELGFVIDSRIMTKRVHDLIEESAPGLSYEVRLSAKGQTYWLEQREDRVVRHDTEPGTTAWQRIRVSLLSLLPIDWLL